MTKPKVAFSKEFLEAYSGLPRAQQKKVREFTEKFQRDPTQRGINFERITDARDSKVRSVRIDQAYRAIVVQPPKGDVYLCVWVDHHDEAYRWARNRVFEVNPTSGVFQLYEVETVAPPATTQAPATGAPAHRAPKGLFAAHGDEDLLLAGVPAPLLPSVRALVTEAELDLLAKHMPEDAAEMLYYLAAGYDLLVALEESERAKAKQPVVDVQDFATALAKPESQRTFAIVEGEEELAKILSASLQQWRIFLHPSQRKLVEMNANGPVRVLGSAGTGKTVVLMHRARHLASKVFTEADSRILVTTFTKNLAGDLEQNLKALCGSEFSRLEVTNLHAWSTQFLKRHGLTVRVAPPEEQKDFWEAAVAELGSAGLTSAFYREEWARVVQFNGILEAGDYITARRVGRGTRLSRGQKAEVWKVFQRYRELLQDAKAMEWPDLVREARLLIQKQSIPPPYKAVLVDEVQDFSRNELLVLRALVAEVPNDMFVVGDGHQRIYGQRAPLGQSGIQIRGRSRRLKLNYRTTDQIRKFAVALLEGKEIDDLDEGRDTLKGYCSLRSGAKPEVKHFSKESQEAEFIVQRIRAWTQTRPAEEVCLTARTNGLLKSRYEKILQAAGIPFAYVEPDSSSESAKPGVRLATMHRLKGLEFPNVLLAGVQKGQVPLDAAVDSSADEASRQDHDLQERCLLYVAATRARDELVVTGFGDRSPYL